MHDIPVRTCSASSDVLADVIHHGIALITDVAGPAVLIELAGTIGTIVPRNGSSGVTIIEDRGARTPAMAAFTRVAIPPRTAASGIANPPGLLVTACGGAPTSGGESLLADGQAVHDDLSCSDPAALAALSTPRSALFGGAGGHLGSVFSEDAGGGIAVRLRLDALVRFAPVVTPHLPALRAAIQRNLIVLPAVVGSGYVLDNRRWLHGRLAYEGPRLMQRITAEPHTGRVPDGFSSRLQRDPPGTATIGLLS